MSHTIKLLLILIFTPTLMAFLGGGVAHLRNEGWFEQWQPLGKPSEKAIRIFVHEEKFPFVETTDNRIYSCYQALLGPSKGCWVEFDPNSRPKVGVPDPCYPSFHFDIPKPPGQVIDMVNFHSCQVGLSPITVTSQRNFALLDDGSVWMWQHNSSAADWVDIFLYGMGGGILGFLVAVKAMVIIDYRASLFSSHSLSTFAFSTLPNFK